MMSGRALFAMIVVSILLWVGLVAGATWLLRLIWSLY